MKGDIGSREAMDYLHGLVEIIKASGYKGLVIVIDEAETILRMRRDVRGKSLNGIRQICDAADRYRGLLWIFTGTPEFYDTKRGVAGLQPLHDRIQFLTHGGFANPRQAQLALEPFNAERLTEVALKLRELYPTADRTRLISRVTPAFIDQLVAKVTTGFKGDVGVVPRQFLRHFVDVLDLVAEHDDFDPMAAEGCEPKDPNARNSACAVGMPPTRPTLKTSTAMRPWSSSDGLCLCPLPTTLAGGDRVPAGMVDTPARAGAVRGMPCLMGRTLSSWRRRLAAKRRRPSFPCWPG